MKEFTEEEYRSFVSKHNTITLFDKIFSLEKPVIKEIEPKDFKLETTTVFSFKERGSWATHYLNASYRGNFAPEIARNMILRYTKPREIILDPMCGSGTTLIEAKLLGRNALGVDINPNAIVLVRNRINFEVSDALEPRTFVGDAKDLDKLSDANIDLIIAHPPYANIIKYSDMPGDLSNLPVEKFVHEMELIAKEFYRVLKSDHYCAILIGDTRKSKHQVPLAYKVMQRFLDVGFLLKEDIIKVQWNCQATPYWEKRSMQENFYLIMHEHLFIFRKP